MLERAIFCRIGWMKYYDGKKPDDPRPIGGGSWNKRYPGSERFNFRNIRGKYYGFCRPSRSHNINLERIDPTSQGNFLERVLVVFVAVDPDLRNQRVVGWYKNATVYRLLQKSPPGRESVRYLAVANAKDSVLLRTEPYERNWHVVAGTGGIGESNACYLPRGPG